MTSPAKSAAAPGKLVTVEGIDGGGKTTLAGNLAARLREAGYGVELSHEPTQGPEGLRLRESAKAGRLSAEEELELFIADRRRHCAELIRPSLAAGRWVVLDRYFHSNAAYQGARGLDTAEILRRNREFAPEPDLLILVDLPVETALERIRGSRGETPNAFEKADSLRAVAAQFERIVRDMPPPRGPFRVLRLDGSLPPGALAARALEVCLALETSPTPPSI